MNRKPYQQVTSKNLSPSSINWLESYIPHSPSIFTRILNSLFFDSSKGRAATLPKDAEYIELIAYQCQRQGVSYPRRIYVTDSEKANASYVPFFRLINATSYLISKGGSSLEPVIAHEVGHSAQGLIHATHLLLTLASGLVFSELASKILKVSKKKDFKNLEKIFNNSLFAVIGFWSTVQYVSSKCRRYIEFDADNRGAKYTTPEKMKDALAFIRDTNNQSSQEQKREVPLTYWTMKVGKKIVFPFPTHPKYEERIDRLSGIKEELKDSYIER